MEVQVWLYTLVIVGMTECWIVMAADVFVLLAAEQSVRAP